MRPVPAHGARSQQQHSRRHGVALVLGITTFLLAGMAQAALLDRDLDKNGVTDAFYDTDLDITWLRDANLNGPQGWSEAADWAAGFSIGGFADWRLPTADPACSGRDCIGGEIGHLWYIGLGNTFASGLTNMGGFQHLESFWYWSANEIPGSSVAYAFDMRNGLQGLQITAANSNQLFAMAVTNGDVAPVPEPATYALLLAGLAGIGLAAARKKA